MENLPPPPPPSTPPVASPAPLTPSFVEAVQDAFKRYASFSGRTSRRGYWWVWLSYIIALLSVTILVDAFTVFVQMVYALPMLATAVRRMHDTGRSGWFILVPFYGFYLACSRGSTDDNKYGPAPR